MMTLLHENWRPVVGFPQYAVSDQGRVRSWTERGGGKLLAQRARRNHLGKITDYQVSLGRGGYSKRIHRLVLEAFIGPCPGGMEACHNDGDPANNRLGNLRWDTHKSNMSDAISHGTHRNPPTHYGEKHPNARLTDQQVEEIRALGDISGKSVSLGKKYGVSYQTIRRIARAEGRYA